MELDKIHKTTNNKPTQRLCVESCNKNGGSVAAGTGDGHGSAHVEQLLQLGNCSPCTYVGRIVG